VTTVAFVFARGGSKGLPGKNLRPLGGVPLVARAVQAAQDAATIDRVVVSTDDPSIADVARQYGADVPWLRPPELATDEASEWWAWQHAVRETFDGDEPSDIFVSVPPTAPLRHPDDIDACVERLSRGDCDIVVTTRQAERNPWFNMVVLDDAGHVRRCIEDTLQIARRQDAPAVFDLTTVAYAARPGFILVSDGIFDGVVAAVEVPRERAVDVDEALDFAIAECLLGRGDAAR
jgi:N-acylneuraminate cytidylyltransferase